MALRGRSRKKTKAVVNEAHGDEAALRLESSGPVNSTGLPALPPELLLEIISHLPSLPVPALPKDLEKTYVERARLLRDLSQMCRLLRRVFLPIVWERIETFRRNASSKSLATELVRQLEIVTVRDPTLAAYVKIVNVKLTSYSCETVMEEFGRCLALFRNLKTIQILWTPQDHAPRPHSLMEVFGHRQFPSVRTVVVPDYAAPILQSCPSVRFVTWTSHMQVDSTIAWCPNIQKFSGCVHYPSPGQTIEWISWQLVEVSEDQESCPTTRRVLLDSTTYARHYTYAIEKTIDCFKAISRLSCITIKVPGDKDAGIPPNILPLVEQAQRVLQEKDWLDGQQTNCACLKYTNGTSKFVVNRVPALKP